MNIEEKAEQFITESLGGNMNISTLTLKHWTWSHAQFAKSLEPRLQVRGKEEQNKDLNYWKNNAEEDYMKVPISVLRYISELEELLTNK